MKLKDQLVKRADEALKHAAKTGECSPKKLVDDLLNIIGAKVE